MSAHPSATAVGDCLPALLALAAALALSRLQLGDRASRSTEPDQRQFERGLLRAGPARRRSTTKNTIRIPGEDPAANAAGAAITVYPSNNAFTRPKSVTVAGDERLARGDRDERALGAARQVARCCCSSADELCPTSPSRR